MSATVKKLTHITLAHEAIKATLFNKKQIKSTLFDIYGWEHSISRTQIFWIEVNNVPAFTQGHLTRHKIGVEWFCESRRPDRSNEKEITNRMTPVNYSMLINAEALINIARVRLCFKASKETRQIVFDIKQQMKDVDIALADHMLPNCFHQGMICKEPKPCGKYPVKKWKNYIQSLSEVFV